MVDLLLVPIFPTRKDRPDRSNIPQNVAKAPSTPGHAFPFGIITTVRGQLLEMLKVVATALEQDLRDRLVFVESCTTALYACAELGGFDDPH